MTMMQVQFWLESMVYDAELMNVATGEGVKETIVQFKRIVSDYSWREIKKWKGDAELTKEVDDCINLLSDVKEAVS